MVRWYQYLTLLGLLIILSSCLFNKPDASDLDDTPVTTMSEVTFEGIRVVGEDEFREATLLALRELKGKSSFQQIQPYIAVIREGKKSGMRAFDKEPTFEVGLSTWRHSTAWYASAIVHDGHHSELYHHNLPWTGTESEKKCLALQKQALVELQAPISYVQYVDALMVNPTYHLEGNLPR